MYAYGTEHSNYANMRPQNTYQNSPQKATNTTSEGRTLPSEPRQFQFQIGSLGYQNQSHNDSR